MKPKQGLGRALGVHHGSVGLSIRSRSSGQCELPNSGLKRVTLVFESRRFHGLWRDARCGTADAFVKTVQIGGQELTVRTALNLNNAIRSVHILQ